jgi:hypothetical protein
MKAATIITAITATITIITITMIMTMANRGS